VGKVKTGSGDNTSAGNDYDDLDLGSFDSSNPMYGIG